MRKNQRTAAYGAMQFRVVAENDDERVIEGIANTLSVDSYDTIVDPAGATFTLPLPLLMQHNSREPVGEVFEAEVSGEQIRIRARITKVDNKGPLQQRLDDAWQAVKHRLLKGLSVGFTVQEIEAVPDSWTYRITKWVWHELSVVTLPSNTDCTIEAVRSAFGAAPGATKIGAVPGPAVVIARAVGKPVKKSVTTMPRTVGEHIAALQNTRAEHVSRMAELSQGSIDQSITMTEEQNTEFETLSDEVRSVDNELSRLNRLQEVQSYQATPVGRSAAPAARAAPAAVPVTAAAPARLAVPAVHLRHRPQLAPGVALARLVRARGLSFMCRQDDDYLGSARNYAHALYGEHDEVTQFLEHRANVAAATTLHATWAKPLVGQESTIFADFVEWLRPQTILGKFGANGVPSLRRIPFRTALISQTSGGNAYWVGEGKPKPLTKFDFARTTLGPLKVASICVSTMELLRDSSPSAETILRDQLGEAVKARLDSDFVDPAITATTNIRPASITNGVSPIASSGNDAAHVRQDLQALFALWIAQNNAPTDGVWIMSPGTALALSLMTYSDNGVRAFPGVNMNGGVLEGLPVITSQYVVGDVDGGVVILVNASDIYFADDGDISVDASSEASLQMLDNPTNAVTSPPVPTSMVSMWQTNSVAFRAERTVNWAKRRTYAVQMLDEVNWGQVGPSA